MESKRSIQRMICIEKILRILIFPISCLISYKVYVWIFKMLNLFHSLILSYYFKSSGRRIRIEYPIKLIGPKYIKIGDNFIANSRLRIEAYKSGLNDPEIIIGNNVNINYDCHIGCINKIEISDNVLIASRVFITDHSHGRVNHAELLTPPVKRALVSKGPVKIEKNVWIGEAVIIMPNVTIGESSIIGANSVVTNDVPPFSVVIGIPARVVKNLKID